jgi:hypothetical protein
MGGTRPLLPVQTAQILVQGDHSRPNPGKFSKDAGETGEAQS